MICTRCFKEGVKKSFTTFEYWYCVECKQEITLQDNAPVKLPFDDIAYDPITPEAKNLAIANDKLTATLPSGSNYIPDPWFGNIPVPLPPKPSPWSQGLVPIQDPGAKDLGDDDFIEDDDDVDGDFF